MSAGRASDPLWGAIGDPTRRQILDALLAEGEATATELAQRVPVSRQAVAKHLEALERAGLVNRRRFGRDVRFAVEPERLENVARAMTRIADEWDDRLSRIKRIAERLGRTSGNAPQEP
jgi:DNA-binding transcriptional ArsR family regulator